MFRVETPTPQPLFQEDIIIIINMERNQTSNKGKLFCWLDSNPEHVYDYHEQEDIKLI